MAVKRRRAASADARRMSDLLDRVEVDLRAAFMEMIARVRTQLTPDSIERMIAERRFADAQDAFTRGANLFSQDIADSFALSAADAAKMLTTALGVIVHYDQFNERAITALRESNLELVREFTAQQTAVVRAVVEDGIAAGTNPVQIAREFRDSIGLTEFQERAVANYRRLLENQSTAALERELRDRRFDSTVRRSILENAPLSPEQVDRMVGRYRDRYVQYRAETIARTEALRAVHEGMDEMFRQVAESGDVDPGGVTRIWNTAGDERVRFAHQSMDGQERGLGDPFTDGDGIELDYPGDPQAPPQTSINCRCVVATRISVAALAPQPAGA